MTQSFRKVFLSGFEEKLLTEFTVEENQTPINYRSAFKRQARQIVDICFNPEMKYRAVRIK
jgi:hypothetical protein